MDRARVASTCRFCATPEQVQDLQARESGRLDYYRTAAFLPEALLNTWHIGWSIAGISREVTLQAMILGLHLRSHQPGGGSRSFDLVKVGRRVNADYLRAPGRRTASLARCATGGCPDEFLRRWYLSRAQCASSGWTEFVPMTEFFFSGDVDHAPVEELGSCQSQPPRTCPSVYSASSRGVDVQRRFLRRRRWKPWRAALPRNRRGTAKAAVHGHAPAAHRTKATAAAL